MTIGKGMKSHDHDMLVYAPPILFHSKAKSKDTSTSEANKEKFVKFDVDVDTQGTDKVEWSVRIFEDDGDAETYVKWRIRFDELCEALKLDTVEKKHAILQTILRGEARARFNSGYQSVVIPESASKKERKELEEAKLNAGYNNMSKNLFVPAESAWRRQRFYMRYNLHFGKMSVNEFVRRLQEMNKYLKYFPAPKGKKHTSMLDESELLEILDRAKPHEYQLDILASNYDPYSKSYQEFVEYLERLEVKAAIQKKLEQEKKGGNNGGQVEKAYKKKGRNKGSFRPRDSNDNRAEENGHSANNDSSEHPRNANKKRPFNKGGKGGKKRKTQADDEVKFTANQMSFLMKNFRAFKPNPYGKKRKVSVPDDSDGSSSGEEHNHFLTKADNNKNSVTKNDNSAYESDYSVSHEHSFNIARAHKRRKKAHGATELIAQVRDNDNNVVPVRVLLDSGTSASIVLAKFVRPIDVQPDSTVTWKTMGGTFVTKKRAIMKFKLPEFSETKTITWPMHVDEHSEPSQVQYDMIIGTDIMEAIGMDLRFSTKTIEWDNVIIPMKERGLISNPDAAELIFHSAVQSPLIKKAEERHAKILDADYSAVNIDEYVDSLNNLSLDIKTKLKETLKKTPNAFKGGLGTLKIKPINLKLKPEAVPYYAKPFPIPKAYEETTRRECRRFCDIGVWYHNPDSEWAAPTFIQPKKTGDVRILTDFRQLNKCIIRAPYPLPKIQDMLQKLEGFSYATALDLSMGYYHIPLSKQAQRLCTTVLPWGKFSYAKLPMGLSTSPDIFQSIMNELLGDLPYVLVYIDDILILNKRDESEDDHLEKIAIVLDRLERCGFAVNLRKSFFMQQELEYLGYLLTPNGIKPQPKKVEAISRILPPKNKRQMRRFLGMINYYRDMWRRRSHVLAPLTDMVSKSVPWKWTDKHQQAFEQAKQMVMREAMLAYPDFSDVFHVFTDASDYQLGGVIMQKGKPLAFYTRKLNKAQTKYPTGEQELLAIVETLKEFQSILLGQRIIVHTDHLNLLYDKLASNRLIRWRMLIEEFGPKFKHVSGPDNIVADTLSRIDMEHRDKDEIDTGDEAIQLSYMTAEEVIAEEFPMNPKLIQREQQTDQELQRLMAKDQNARFGNQPVEGVELIHMNGKIFIPESLRERIIAWYHQFLVHPGRTRMEATIRQNFIWPGLTPQIDNYCKTCHECQLFKKQRKKYGHLPPKQAELTPWTTVCVDLIGPYSVKTTRKTYELRAMTMLDPATGWFEIAPITKPNSDETQRAFDSYWLARYPRPREICYDNGKEFKWLFAELCDNMGIGKKNTTEYNPQANAMIERVHQVLGNALRTFELEKQQQLSKINPFEPFLTATAYAIRSTYHTTLKATPGQLVFGRDMLLPTNFKADWASIALRKQKIIDESNARENKKRIPHEYKVGDKVLLERPGIQPKMGAPRDGPFEVVHVSTNGTVRIQKGAVTQRVNIRRLTPYFERRPSGSVCHSTT